MTLSLGQLEEARRALDAPLFADLAGDALWRNAPRDHAPPA